VFITAEVDETVDVQPASLVTVKVYVPAVKPVKVAVVPEPVCVAPPGEAVIVQVPDGSPLIATLPVASVHVGCVTVPRIGAVGVAGCALITTFTEAGDVQPKSLVTVNV
jgi:hypothetical protein